MLSAACSGSIEAPKKCLIELLKLLSSDTCEVVSEHGGFVLAIIDVGTGHLSGIRSMAQPQSELDSPFSEAKRVTRALRVASSLSCKPCRNYEMWSHREEGHGWTHPNSHTTSCSENLL